MKVIKPHYNHDSKPMVGELFVKLILIIFLMQLLSTFEHALRTFDPEKIILNTRLGI